MIRPQPGHHGCAAVASLIAVLWCTPEARAQDVTEPSLKAAFVYNFAKFTEWPQDVLSATTPFVACVMGDATVGDALRNAIIGRLLLGRPIRVVQAALDGNPRPCHLLYVSGLTDAQLTLVMTSVRGLPILTISDADDFALIGGIAQVFVENGRMRFTLNLDVATRVRLRLSSKLLALATRVYEGPNPVGR